MKKKSTATTTAAAKQARVQKPRRPLQKQNLPSKPVIQFEENTPLNSIIKWEALPYAQDYEVARIIAGGPQGLQAEPVETTKNLFYRVPPAILDTGAQKYIVRGTNCNGQGLGPWSNEFFVQRPAPAPTPTTANPPTTAAAAAPAAAPAAAVPQTTATQEQRPARRPLPWWAWLLIALAIICLICGGLYTKCPTVRSWVHNVMTSTTAGTVSTNQSGLPGSCMVTQYVQTTVPAVHEEARPICINNHDGGVINFDTRGSSITIAKEKSAQRTVATHTWTRTQHLQPVLNGGAPVIGTTMTIDTELFPGENIAYYSDWGWTIAPLLQLQDVEVYYGNESITEEVVRANANRHEFNAPYAQIKSKVGHVVPIRWTLTYVGTAK